MTLACQLGEFSVCTLKKWVLSSGGWVSLRDHRSGEVSIDG